MTKIIQTTVYNFEELDEKAKEKARDWFREADSYGDDAWETTQEDANNIGLKLTGAESNGYNVRSVDGEFIISAIECMEKIFSEHGEHCDTYKAAKKLDDALDALPELPAESAANYWEVEREICSSVDALEGDFLTDILKCYAKMYEKELEYRNSNEHIDETIIANEYTFTVDGKRFG